MKRALCAALLMIAAGPTSTAHHSYAAYHTDRLIDVEGVVEAFDWISPHSLLKIRADDGRLYIGEWRAAAAMHRTGVDRDTLRLGDRLVVSGNPRRDIDDSGVVNIKAIRRLADGWRWPAS
jgi:hypothetical protein